VHFNVRSQVHNPQGDIRTEDMRLPVEDGSVDRIILQSVFTHNFESDIVHLLKELRRVLKKDGLVMATFFIVDRATIRALRNTPPSQRAASCRHLTFPFNVGRGCYIQDRQYPEGAVAFTPGAVNRMLKEGGMELAQPIHYGEWSGARGSTPDPQDVLVIRRSPHDPVRVRRARSPRKAEQLARGTGPGQGACWERALCFPSHFLRFLKDLVANRSLVMELTRKDFRSRYLGSYLGLLWAFIHPTITVLILWFVFTVGLKAAAVNDLPFVLWLLAGIIPWFFFAEGLGSGAQSVVENRFLVKKVVFRVSFLPVVKLLSALLIHLFFLAATLLIFTIHRRPPGLHAVQLLYYLPGLVILLMGLSWMISAMVVFARDLGQVVAVLLQFGFWLTPIFWSVDLVPQVYRPLLKANPVFFVVQGYRDALSGGAWFWEHGMLNVYFWCVTGAVFILGGRLFKRLRPHFADVL
jgi:lipopolysaccharide transport system permease protein/teichoic acid transport system permease protein